MNHLEALDVVIGRTKHERFRSLCDDAHPDREVWRARIVEMAVRPPEAPPAVPCGDAAPIPVAESLVRLRAMKACPHWMKSTDCGCGNNRCAAGKGAAGVVSHRDCFDCLAASSMDPAG